MREEVQAEALVRDTGSDVRPADLRGIRAFREDYPEARTALLYLGSRPIATGGIRGTPCEGFLSSLVPGQVPAALRS